MAGFTGTGYAPPGPYSTTDYDAPQASALESLRVPILIGEGNEFLSATNVELVRGSTSHHDQQIVSEDETGRSVVSVGLDGHVTLGDADGVLTKFQVRNLPIVDGKDNGTVTMSRGDVAVTIDGQAIVVRSVNGNTGIVELAQAPQPGQLVRCSYFFNRLDTLATDNVSGQVTATAASVDASQGISDVNAQAAGTTVLAFAAAVGATAANNVLSLLVDGVLRTVVIPPRSTYTMAQVAAAINSVSAGSLTATTFIDAYGLSCLRLHADSDLLVQDGSANQLLGLASGQSSMRTKTFYTFNGPIVDGSNMGATTTDPTKVTVLVDGVQVIPTKVVGQTRAVTLPVSPKAGAVVTIRYYHNTWQDTFDYLPNPGVVAVTQVGDTPNKSEYVSGAGFILNDGKIIWGTASTVAAGVTTAGGTVFGAGQVSSTLVDDKIFLAACQAVSATDWQLPEQPTLGNGRETKLGKSLFQTVSNDRIDLPVNRPDVVSAYWGWDVQEAITRGPVPVLRVEGLVVTLGTPVPAGASVWVSFYYNRITSSDWTVTAVHPGNSGDGTYEVSNQAGASLVGASFNPASKSAGLDGIEVTWPSGSEALPDLLYSPVAGAVYRGPIEERATVTFAERTAEPARVASPGNGPFDLVSGQSDHLRFLIDGAALASGAAGLNLSSPTGNGPGFNAVLIGSDADYVGGTGATVGESYTLDADQEINFEVDGVSIKAVVPAGENKTLAHFADYINEAANGHAGLVRAATNTTIVLDVGTRKAINEYYTGWKIAIGHNATYAVPSEVLEVSAYDGSTGTATVPAWDVDSTASGAIQFLGVPADGTTVSIAGVTFTAVAVADAAAQQFSTAGTTVEAATSLAASINHGNSQTLFQNGTARTVAAVSGGSDTVTLTAGAPGLMGRFLLVKAGAGVASLALTQMTAALPNYSIYNPATMAQYVAATRFTGSLSLATDKFNKLDFVYVGYETGEIHFGATLGDGPYANANAIAIAVQAAMQAEIDASITDENSLEGLQVLVSADSSNRLVFKLQRAGMDGGGLLAFAANADPSKDFAVLAGIDTGSEVAGGQAVLMQAEIAKVVSVATIHDHDRLLIRNRLLPGGAGSLAARTVVDQARVIIGAGSGNAFAGLETGAVSRAGSKATIAPATLAGKVTLVGGQDAGTKQPIVTFYDGNGSATANNVLKFQLDGIDVTTTFTATGTGQATPLGPLSNASSVLGQIATALGTVLGVPFGNPTNVKTRLLVRQEGLGLRLTSSRSDAKSGITIKAGSANGVLGLAEGLTAERTLVPVSLLVSALNADRQTNFVSALLSFTATDGGTPCFAEVALAAVAKDAANQEYLFIQSLSAGSASSVQWKASSSKDALASGTGLLVALDTIDYGEAAIGGFYVVSEETHGSGSVNTSVLNNGVGQDGVIGQTYRDRVTGLTFTILPRGFHDNEAGPWTPYPAGASFVLVGSKTFVADANVPIKAIPGLELVVSNTAGIATGDTVQVKTYSRNGPEPKVGDLYYASYTYRKTDLKTSFFTKFSALEKAFGAVSPENPLSMAAYLSMLNGAVLLGCKQVARAEGQSIASLEAYSAAISDLEGTLPGQVTPDVIVPLRGDSDVLFQVLAKSCDKMSSQRYRSERTAIIGLGAGRTPTEAQNLATLLSNERMRLVYPDMVVVPVTDFMGNTREYLVDGFYMAAALAGSVVNPNFDVASPWTNRKLVGFSQTGRKLDEVQMNQIAQAGVTIIKDKSPFLLVRHGLTTDMSRLETKLPTIVQIQDEVQRQGRDVTEPFVGSKFLADLLTAIEGRLSMRLKSLVAAQILASYMAVKAMSSSGDMTAAEVEASYVPIFPLLYLFLTLHLRGTNS